ncbi:hypothetical protein N7E02_13915 [Aliirhizobium terrae]|uniref:hypothetical protein n=1 Tax=Terrirhizobium terrae TaxID=2926709 RepID=UPI002575ACC7|nr:hypothetical protein [Rhizobium sp. CC-CFT758]WJH41459.1 hypothetical protein N7E02_13915 [Rhizobium sp. CC-CFT758]
MDAGLDLDESERAELGRRKAEFGGFFGKKREGDLLAAPQQNSMRVQHPIGSQGHRRVLPLG